MTGALVDSGATNNFITPAFTQKLYLTPIKLLKPRTIRNVDGTTNQGGQITKYVDIVIQQHMDEKPWWTRPLTMRQRFYLADLGEDDVILGYPWLLTIDEPINWIDHEQNPGIIALHEEWALEEGDEIIM